MDDKDTQSGRGKKGERRNHEAKEGEEGRDVGPRGDGGERLEDLAVWLAAAVCDRGVEERQSDEGGGAEARDGWDGRGGCNAEQACETVERHRV